MPDMKTLTVDGITFDIVDASAARRTDLIVSDVSGEVVTVNDASDHILEGLTLYGKTVQFTTTGKNLLKNTATTKTINGVTFSVNDDGSITVNGTATADINLELDASSRQAGTYFLSGAAVGTLLFCAILRSDGATNYISDEGNGVQITLTGTEREVTFYLKIVAGAVVSNARVYPMLRLASVEDDTYEPYTGGMPSPNPDYPQEMESIGDGGSVGVNVCGKNMFNCPEWRNLWIAKGTAVYENNGVTLTATGSDCYTDYGGNFPAKARIPISEGETVTLSWEETSNASGNVVIFPNGRDEGNVGVNNATAKSLTYTAGKGVAFVTFRFGVANAGTTISYKNIQVEHGDTATAFEPYKAAQNLALSTPNGLYAHDYIDCARGVCVQGSAERVLDGTENYSLYTNTTFNNTQIRLHYDGGQKRNASAGSLCGAHCNYFVEVTPDQSYIGTYDGFCVDHKGTVISFNCKGFISNMTTVDEWVSFVKGRYDAGNPIIIRYPLATPIETPLTAEEIAAFKALHTNKPNTTVYTDSNAGIKLDYVADTKTYIDNKFAELAAAIVANA